MFLEEKREGEVIPATVEPWREILLQAADVMEQRGHCKFFLEGPQGSVCFRGAVIVAIAGSMGIIDAAGLRLLNDAEHMMVKSLKLGDAPNCVVDWNNAKWRTGAEVVAAMRSCARSGI